MLIIISAPSGCGKTSIIKKLLANSAKAKLSISATTRPKRGTEKDQIDYYFTTKEQFKKLNLLEQAEIYGNYYGTPRELVEKELQQGFDVYFDIDYQGAKQIKEAVNYKIISFFILPPTMQELRSRIEARGEDSKETIEKRLKQAENEIRQKDWYDHILVNDELDRVVKEIENVIANVKNQDK